MADKSSKANQISAPLIWNLDNSDLHDKHPFNLNLSNQRYNQRYNSSEENLDISETNLNIREENCNILEKSCIDIDNCNELNENCSMSNENSHAPDKSLHIETAIGDDLFIDIRHIRNNYSKNVIIGHLNVNSVGSKINEINEL